MKSFLLPLATALALLSACAAEVSDPKKDEGAADTKKQGDHACAPIPPCPEGEVPVDTGTDGCFDTCGPKQPNACAPIPPCPEGEVPVDTGTDGCFDTCAAPKTDPGQKACAPIAPCKEGEVPVDTGTDGCFDTCAPKK